MMEFPSDLKGQRLSFDRKPNKYQSRNTLMMPLEKSKSVDKTPKKMKSYNGTSNFVGNGLSSSAYL